MNTDALVDLASGAVSPVTGIVASLHIHATKPGQPMGNATSFNLVAEKGITEDPRYFGRISRGSGRPSRRQVSLIEREQMAEHAAVLGLTGFPPGAVRSNIETTGIDLQSLVGAEVEIGGAVLRFYEPRTPCAKMDALCQGLRKLMENNRQGVMAEVIRSGKVRVGDPVRRLSGS
jgi:MOSC domain-containing protein YiiM